MKNVGYILYKLVKTQFQLLMFVKKCYSLSKVLLEIAFIMIWF